MLVRGSKYGDVSKDLDVKSLTDHYCTAQIYSDQLGRNPKGAGDKAVTDFVTAGADALE